MTCLYLVIPCYNEEAVLPLTAAAVTEKLSRMAANGVISAQSRLLFVDDGSRDGTWPLIEALHAENEWVCGLKLSGNCGHQNALLAGLHAAVDLGCDCAVSMDADLQDDIGALDAFLEAYHTGNDVVYGVRRSRDKDTFFKRNSAKAFYKFLRMMGVDVVYNHADYRLMSRRAMQALFEFREVNLFLRGVVPLVGFRSATVSYDRGARAAGTSKYPLRKMLSFALDGITSFSVRPIRIICVLGFLISLLSVAGMLYALISKLVGAAVSGWTAIVMSIWLLGGIQLLSVGVIGEYIGKIYKETKARPKFIVETLLKQ